MPRWRGIVDAVAAPLRAIIGLITLGGPLLAAFLIHPDIAHPELDQDEQFLFPFVIANKHWPTLRNVLPECHLSQLVWSDEVTNDTEMRNVDLVSDRPFDLAYDSSHTTRCPFLASRGFGVFRTGGKVTIKSLTVAMAVPYELRFIPWRPWHREYRVDWTMYRRSNGEAVWVEGPSPRIPPTPN